jgi:hypothetical protein
MVKNKHNYLIIQLFNYSIIQLFNYSIFHVMVEVLYEYIYHL